MKFYRKRFYSDTLKNFSICYMPQLPEGVRPSCKYSRNLELITRTMALVKPAQLARNPCVFFISFNTSNYHCFVNHCSCYKPQSGIQTCTYIHTFSTLVILTLINSEGFSFGVSARKPTKVLPKYFHASYYYNDSFIHKSRDGGG